MSPMKSVVICSAGVGSRLGLDKPKCLAEIEGRPLIHWQLDLLDDYENIVVVVGFRAADVMQTVRQKRTDAIFAVNHDYRTTNTLDSLIMGASALDGPFISLDGDLLVTESALRAIEDAPCPAIGIKRTYSEEPVCVRLGEDVNRGLVLGFIREPLAYEWTGLAKLHPDHVKAAKGSQYVFHAVERLLPVPWVEIDCIEIDTNQDMQEAEVWMRDQLTSGSFGRIAVSA